MKVREIMKDACVVSTSTTLAEAAKIMSSKKISSVLVMNKKELKGIVTEGDLLKHFGKGGSVASIMSTDLETINAKDDIGKAMSVMVNKHIKKLPVLDKDALVGIVSLSDLAAYPDELGEDFFFE